MICLKIITFAVSNTTWSKSCSLRYLLCFAWKLLPLRYQIQQGTVEASVLLRCDLLENYYLCGIKYNGLCFLHNLDRVVICLKIITFAVSNTTRQTHCHCSNQLWFAWKLLPLRYQIQLNNKRIICQIVVICLKIITFAVSNTTRPKPTLIKN